MSEEYDFDQEVEDYRLKQNGHVKLSGETGDFFAEHKIIKLLEWYPEYDGATLRVLDFGCGDGLMTSYAKKHLPEATVFGIDPSAKSIEYALAHYPDIDFRSFDGARSDLPEASFDLIYAAGVFHHVDPDQRESVMAEMRRLLAPGGRMIIFELNPHNPLTVQTFRNSEVDAGCEFLSPDGARKLFGGEGVRIIYYFFFPSSLAFLRPLEKYLRWLPLGALYAAVFGSASAGKR